MTNTEPIVQTKGEIELKSQAPTISGYGVVKSIRREDEQGNLSPSFIILGLWASFMVFPSLGHAQIMYGGGGGGDIQYSEDSPHVSGDKGTMAGVVQQTADTPLSGNGDRSFMQIDENGFLKINLKALSVTLAGENVPLDIQKVEQQFSYNNIVLAAPTTTVIRAVPGMLHSIVINKTTANGVITCYDNTVASGTTIATITQPATLLASQMVLPYNAVFGTGLTCVTSGAAQDITVNYR